MELCRSLRRRDVSPAAADCLIATVALEHHVCLIHCDADFESMKTMLRLDTLDWTSHVRSHDPSKD